MNKLTSVIVIICMFIAISCRNIDVKFEEELQSILRTAESPSDTVNALLELDQKYPDKPSLKAHLGIAYIMTNDITAARIYLVKAESLINKNTTSEIKYLIYAGLTDVFEKQGDFNESKAKAILALDISGEDSLGVQLHVSRAEAALQETEKALKSYLLAFDNQSKFFTENDYSNLVTLLLEIKDYDRAIEVYLHKIEHLGYSPGDGLGLSTIYENTKEYTKSLISASYELWRLIHEDRLSKEEALNRLTEVNSKMLNTLVGKQADDFILVASAQKAIINGNWNQASLNYAKINITKKDPFELFFFSLSELMKSDKPLLNSIKLYVSLESVFRRSQDYYYYLWNIMKKGDGKYTFSIIRPVLDKTVLFGVSTKLAEKTQKEMARLVGLNERDSAYLFPSRYIESLLNSFIEIRDEKILDPIISLLTLSNNPYTDDCMIVLKHYINDSRLVNTLSRDESKRNEIYKLRVLELTK